MEEGAREEWVMEERGRSKGETSVASIMEEGMDEREERGRDARTVGKEKEGGDERGRGERAGGQEQEGWKREEEMERGDGRGRREREERGERDEGKEGGKEEGGGRWGEYNHVRSSLTMLLTHLLACP